MSRKSPKSPKRRARSNPKPRAWSAKGPSRAYVCKSPLVGRTVRLGRSEAVVESCATPSRRHPNKGQFRVRSKATGKSRAVSRRRVSAALYRANHPRKMPAGLLTFWSKTRGGPVPSNRPSLGAGTADPMRPDRRHAPVPSAHFGPGSAEAPRHRPLGYGPGGFESSRRIPLGFGPGSAEEGRKASARVDAYEFRVGKDRTEMRRKRFDVSALVNGNYLPGMSVTVVEEHQSRGSWKVTARVYEGGRGSSREIIYGEGLSRRAAVALAEKVLRAATITRSEQTGNSYVELPPATDPVHEALPLDRLTNAQAASSWGGNRVPAGSPWITNGHFAIRRSAVGTEVPTHRPGERRFSPWNKTLFKALERPAEDFVSPHPPRDIELPHNAEKIVAARLLGWADTGGAVTPRIATFVGEDGTVVNANADYVALIERNLNMRATPFVVGGDPLAGVYWLTDKRSVSALLMPMRGDKPVVSVRENPYRAYTRQNARRPTAKRSTSRPGQRKRHS